MIYEIDLFIFIINIYKMFNIFYTNSILCIYNFLIGEHSNIVGLYCNMLSAASTDHVRNCSYNIYVYIYIYIYVYICIYIHIYNCMGFSEC